MANKTIPQLPLQTGVTDLDLFAIVDSGETITSSITRSEFMSGATNTTFQNITFTPDTVVYAPRASAAGAPYNSYFTVVHSGRPGNTAKGINQVCLINDNFNASSLGAGCTSIATSNWNMNNTQTGRATISNDNGSNLGAYGVVIGGTSTQNSGGQSFVGSGYIANVSGNNSIFISSQAGNVSGTFSASLANNQNSKTIAGSYNTAISNNGGELTTSGVNCGMYNSKDSNITGSTQFSTMIGCSGRTATNNFTTYVETLEAFDGIVMTDYANLNFTGDTAAAAGNVPLGGLYHDAGAMRIRIT